MTIAVIQLMKKKKNSDLSLTCNRTVTLGGLNEWHYDITKALQFCAVLVTCCIVSMCM